MAIRYYTAWVCRASCSLAEDVDEAGLQGVPTSGGGACEGRTVEDDEEMDECRRGSAQVQRADVSSVPDGVR